MTTGKVKKNKISANEVRKFGVTLAVALALLSALFLWRQKSCYWYFLILSSVFLFLSLFFPAVLKPVRKLWMTLSNIMGWVMTRVILIFLFYAVVTPTALLIRVLNKDILNIKFAKNSLDSYWLPKESRDSKNRDYEKQF